MSYPYSHPSMPGTPADFPSHTTHSPERTPSWHDTCAEAAAISAVLPTPTPPPLSPLPA